MKVAKVAGVVQSFFWKSDGYRDPEIDLEINTGGVSAGKWTEDWIEGQGFGRAYFTVLSKSPNIQFMIELPFNPADAFHRYGWLWTPGSIRFTIDGQEVASLDHLPEGLNGTRADAPRGYIMANIWSGYSDWGGGHPTVNATVQYDWMKFYSGATSIIG